MATTTYRLKLSFAVTPAVGDTSTRKTWTFSHHNGEATSSDVQAAVDAFIQYGTFLSPTPTSLISAVKETITEATYDVSM